MYRNIIFDLDETLVMSYKATELLFEFIVSNNDIPVSGNDFRMVFRRHKLEFMDKFKRFEFYNYGIGTYDLFLNENIFNYVPQQYSDFQYGILETTFDE